MRSLFRVLGLIAWCSLSPAALAQTAAARLSPDGMLNPGLVRAGYRWSDAGWLERHAKLPQMGLSPTEAMILPSQRRGLVWQRACALVRELKAPATCSEIELRTIIAMGRPLMAAELAPAPVVPTAARTSKKKPAQINWAGRSGEAEFT